MRNVTVIYTEVLLMRRVIKKTFVVAGTVFVAVLVVGAFTVAEWRLPDRVFKFFVLVCLGERR